MSQHRVVTILRLASYMTMAVAGFGVVVCAAGFVRNPSAELVALATANTVLVFLGRELARIGKLAALDQLDRRRP